MLLFLTGLSTSCLQKGALPHPTITQSLDVMTHAEVARETRQAILATVTPTGQSCQETITATAIPTASVLKYSLQLTFLSDRSGKDGLYAIDVNCLDDATPCLGEPKLLFEWDEGIHSFAWSPNGQRIVLSSGRYNGQLFLADWDGKNAVQITELCDSATWQKWSSDGTKVAFIYAEGKQGCDGLEREQIQIYDIETGLMKSVFDALFSPSRVYWVPGGQFAYVAKISETNWTKVIDIVDSDGVIIQRVLESDHGYGDIFDVCFSPDGKRLSFVGERDPSTGKKVYDIYMTDTDGVNPLNITNGFGISFDPVWSPFGDWLAFSSEHGSDFDIYLVLPDRDEFMNVTHDPAMDGNPAWRVTSK